MKGKERERKGKRVKGGDGGGRSHWCRWQGGQGWVTFTPPIHVFLTYLYSYTYKV